MVTLSLNKVFRPNVSLRLAFAKGLGCLSIGETMACDLWPTKEICRLTSVLNQAIQL